MQSRLREHRVIGSCCVQLCEIERHECCCFPGVSNSKESAYSAGDSGSIPGLGKSPGEGNGNPLQYSCLENPMDRRAWQATVHVVTRVRHDLVTKPSHHWCMSIFHIHKRRLYTWTSPDGQNWNQIDNIFCSQRWRSSIQWAKTRWGADCGSDHKPLLQNSDLNWRKQGKPLVHSGMT